jgi:methyl-accepting chemotaxis protein
MKIIDIYRSRLWLRIMFPISLVIIAIISAIIYLSINSEYTLLNKQLNRQNIMLAKAIKGGMEDALAIGNNDVVRDQFKKLKKELPDVKVHIYDFKQRISFSTEKTIGETHSKVIQDNNITNALDKMLTSGNVENKTYSLKIDNERYRAVIYPILNEEKCYHCHGRSKKVLGGMTVVASTETALKDIEKTRNMDILLGLISLIIVISIIYLLIRIYVSNRVSKILTNMGFLSDGDFTNRLEFKGSDELCLIATRMNLVSSDLSKILSEIRINGDGINKSSSVLSEISEGLSMGSHEASENATSVASAAEEMSSNMNSIAAASEQATSNLSLIAASAEEMNSTVQEIAQNSNSAKTIVDKAVDEVNEVSQVMTELSEAALEIDSVTSDIQQIAGQVSLLALNAKIEAARAGEAGKGFTIVAQEITELSIKTSQAVIEAEEKLEWIQNKTKETAEKVSDIATIIGDSNDSITTIAAAAEEQSISSKEIAENVSQASIGINGVNENVSQSAVVAIEVAKQISEIDGITTGIDSGSEQVENSAKDLSGMAENLKEMLNKFKL